jgi:hypothetical protein
MRMARKKNLTPEELAQARELLADLRRELRELMAFVETKLAKTA